jgi:hypothetical protein
MQLESEKLAGVFIDYETLTGVLIREHEGNVREIETSSVISVEYPGALGTRLRWEQQLEQLHRNQESMSQSGVRDS